MLCARLAVVCTGTNIQLKQLLEPTPSTRGPEKRVKPVVSPVDTNKPAAEGRRFVILTPLFLL